MYESQSVKGQLPEHIALFTAYHLYMQENVEPEALSNAEVSDSLSVSEISVYFEIEITSIQTDSSNKCNLFIVKIMTFSSRSLQYFTSKQWNQIKEKLGHWSLVTCLISNIKSHFFIIGYY